MTELEAVKAELEKARAYIAHWDEVKEKISLTCHCCGYKATDWSGYYSSEHSEETRVFLCGDCCQVFLSEVMSDLNSARCQDYLKRAKKELRP